MDISSSSDSKDIQELCGNLSVVICKVEIEMDSAFSNLKHLKDTLNYFKEVYEDAHRHIQENRREDILCFHSIAENMKIQLCLADQILTRLRAEIDDNLNN